MAEELNCTGTIEEWIIIQSRLRTEHFEVAVLGAGASGLPDRLPDSIFLKTPPELGVGPSFKQQILQRNEHSFTINSIEDTLASQGTFKQVLSFNAHLCISQLLLPASHAYKA